MAGKGRRSDRDAPLRADALRSVLLVHGAANGPWVFEGWAATFPDADVYAVDLHAGLNVAEASMWNYEAAVASAAGMLDRPLGVCGWSMGGLAAMMAARRVEPELLVLLEPSPPGEVQGFDETLPLETGTFDGEEVYGRFPDGMGSRPDSLLARGERKRGISVRPLPDRTLVVSGREFAEKRGAALAEFYGIDHLAFPDASHWDLVRNQAIREEIAVRLYAEAASSDSASRR